MPQFQYRAQNQVGKTIQGEITAATSRDAIQRLRRQDLLVTHLTEKVVRLVDTSQWKRSWRNPRVTNKELIVFTHQFATVAAFPWRGVLCCGS